MKRNVLALLFIYFCAYIHQSFAQPCGPHVQSYSWQGITKSGNLLLIDFFDSTGLERYTLISKDGTVIKDSLLHERRPITNGPVNSFYDQRICASSQIWKRHAVDGYYNYAADYCTTCINCANHLTYYTDNDDLILGRFLSNDPGNLYLFQIDNKGNASYEYIYSEDIGIDKELSDYFKYQKFDAYLKDKFEGATPLFDDSIRYKLGEQSIRVSHDVNLVEVEVPILDVYSQSKTLYKWKLTGKDWEIDLDGDIVLNRIKKTPSLSFGPLLQKRNPGYMLYITVYNRDSESCPGYGRDAHPIVYKIDYKNGKILWELKIE